jgi:YaiO family outer membrane protein
MKAMSAAFVLLALASATAAAGQTAEEDYQAGVAARHAGQFDEALRRLARALESEPENADIHLQIGFVHLATNRLEEARSAFNRALALAPDYADAREGLARVEQRLRPAPAPPPARRWRIDVDGSYSNVDGQPDWQSASVNLQYRASEATALALLSEATRRFERTDVYTEARVDHLFAAGSSIHLLAGGTPDADHRPSWQIGAGASIRLHGGGEATMAQVDFRLAHYPTGDVQILNSGIEQYIAGRAWITLRWINVWDRFNHSAGWLARFDYAVNDRLRLFAGAADAPDLSEGVVIDTSSLFGGISFDASDRLTLRLTLAHDDPAGPADRTTAAAGLGWRF